MILILGVTLFLLGVVQIYPGETSQTIKRHLLVNEYFKPEVVELNFSREVAGGDIIAEQGNKKKVELVIPEGASSSQIARIIDEKGFMKADSFLKLIKYLDLEKRIKAGKYFIDSGDFSQLVQAIIIEQGR